MILFLYKLFECLVLMFLPTWLQCSHRTAGAAAIIHKHQTKPLYFFDLQLGLPVGTFEGSFRFSFAVGIEFGEVWTQSKAVDEQHYVTLGWTNKHASTNINLREHQVS